MTRFSALLLLFIAAIPSLAQWERISPPPAGALSAVLRIDDSTAIVGDEEGNLVVVGRGMIAQRHATISSRVVSMMRAGGSVWALGERGEIARMNASSSWDGRPSPTSEPLSIIAAGDSLHLWLATSLGAIYQSSDAGTTWAADTLRLPTAISVLLPIDASAAWAAGSEGLWRRDASGWHHLWDSLRHSIVAILPAPGGVDALTAGGSFIHVAVADTSLPLVIDSLGHTLASANVYDATTIIALSNRDSILIGGRAGWIGRPLPLPRAAAIDAPDPAHLSAAYADGDLFTTNDSGKSWQRLNIAQSPIRDVLMLDESHGIALVGDSRVGSIITTDGGVTWEPAGSPIFGSYCRSGRFVWGVSENLVGRADAIGDPWIIDSVPGATLNAIAFSDSVTGFVVGDSARIYSTRDVGATWTRDSVGTATYDSTVSLRSLRCVAASGASAWAAGDSGLVLHRLTSGTWAVDTPRTGYRFVSMSAPTPHVVWAASDRGFLLRWTSADTTWKTVSIPIAASLHRVAFVDSLNGWAVGDAGAVVRTRDGGATWIDESPGPRIDLFALSALDSADVWIGGARGYFARRARPLTVAEPINPSSSTLSASPNPAMRGSMIAIQGAAAAVRLLDVLGRVVDRSNDFSHPRLVAPAIPGIYFATDGRRVATIVILR